MKNDLRNTLLCNDPATEIIKSNVSHIASHTWLPQHQTSAGHMARAPKVRPIIARVATAKRWGRTVARVQSFTTWIFAKVSNFRKSLLLIFRTGRSISGKVSSYYLSNSVIKTGIRCLDAFPASSSFDTLRHTRYLRKLTLSKYPARIYVGTKKQQRPQRLPSIVASLPVFAVIRVKADQIP